MPARSTRPSDSRLRFPELGRGWVGVLMVAAGLGAAGLVPDDPSAPGLAQFSFLPPKGPVGIRVVLEWDAQEAPQAVRFGVLPASFRVVRPGVVETHVPEGAGTGPITLVGESGRAYTSGAPFQVLPERGKPPAISAFWPRSGPGGTELSLSGASLGAVEEVRVGGRVAEFTTLTDTDLTVYIPPDLTVSGPIAVISPFGTAVSGQAFQVTAQAGL
ncbi:MAG: IPT/TIG domain-containing protein [Holophaga sp.]